MSVNDVFLLGLLEELRFIFTSPTFVTEKSKKEKREFYIPRLNRERSLYGTEFEVKLRNELSQKAIAKECADWIRRKVVFKSNVTSENMMGFINVDSKNYMPINGFTTVDLGCERGNNAYNFIQKNDVLYHTDLSRTHGTSNGLDLDRLNWGNYDLVVIDESHNFRNGGKGSGEDDEKESVLRLSRDGAVQRLHHFGDRSHS